MENIDGCTCTILLNSFTFFAFAASKTDFLYIEAADSHHGEVLPKNRTVADRLLSIVLVH